VDFHGAEVAYWLSLALPFYEPGSVRTPIIVEADGESLDVEPIADVAALARAALEQEMPGIVLRTVVRALIKYGAHREAKDRGGEIGGILANALGAATERAETRSWSTLPRDISLVGLELRHPVAGLNLHWANNDGGAAADFLPLGTRDDGGIRFSSGRIWP
jgi:hypothetical protein